MLSERMKELRKANNLTQSELAERIGVSLGAIKHWEQNKGEPNTATLISMAVLFNVSIDYLVARSPRVFNSLLTPSHLLHSHRGISAGQDHQDRFRSQFRDGFPQTIWRPPHRWRVDGSKKQARSHAVV